MYLEHFGLSDYPFRLTPDVDYYYVSSGHARARSYIDFSIVSRDGFVVITGEVGSGKTTMLRKLLREVPEETPIIHIEQTQLTPVEFLQTVWSGLGGDASIENKVELLRRIREQVEKLYDSGVQVVIAVDEAQGLSIDVLEEIRMLSGVESHKDKLLSFVLTGQPELDRVIDHPAMEQLRQRVRLRFKLQGLSMAETWTYIQLRLAIAGADEPEKVIDDSCCQLVHEYTGGIPRLVNTLCDMALLTAYVDERATVDEDAVRSAIEELAWKPYAERYAEHAAATVAPEPVPAKENGGSSSLVVPMTLMNRVAEALERIEGHMDRVARTLPEQDVEEQAPRERKQK